MQRIVDIIKKSEKIILSTHRQCDGDGLGAEIAVYFALQQIGKDVKIINVDRTPKKYRYLQPEKIITHFDENPHIDCHADLYLIFDTNDYRLVEPLYSHFNKNDAVICFIDHHPILQQGPKPSETSYIDVRAASTGELAFQIIQGLDVNLNREIARALYTSITFDTQLYRYVRNASTSHLIAAKLLEYDINPEEIHRYLFANQTIGKIAFLSKVLSQIEYYAGGRLAVLKMKLSDLIEHNLDMDDVRDVIDMIMNIDTLEAAFILREDRTDEFKISLRSKGRIEVVSIAEIIGGGGHSHAAGATCFGAYQSIKDQVLNLLLEKMKEVS